MGKTIALAGVGFAAIFALVFFIAPLFEDNSITSGAAIASEMHEEGAPPPLLGATIDGTADYLEKFARRLDAASRMPIVFRIPETTRARPDEPWMQELSQLMVETMRRQDELLREMDAFYAETNIDHFFESDALLGEEGRDEVARRLDIYAVWLDAFFAGADAEAAGVDARFYAIDPGASARGAFMPEFRVQWDAASVAIDGHGDAVIAAERELIAQVGRVLAFLAAHEGEIAFTAYCDCLSFSSAATEAEFRRIAIDFNAVIAEGNRHRRAVSAHIKDYVAYLRSVRI